MNKKHLFLSAALFAVACNCGAQSLNKEITVERDIVPEYRDADRLRISPGGVLAAGCASEPHIQFR